MSIFLLIIFAYLFGSIPAGLWLGLVLKKIDIRKSGSGNIGATNVARTIGLPVGIITLIFDIFKGYFSVFLSLHYFPDNYYFAILAGIAAILGHNYSLYLRFQGGKGVATTVGAFIALTPLAMFLSLLVFFIVVILSKFISLGSIIAVSTLPVFCWILGYPLVLIVFACFIAGLIVFKHRANIQRLINGTENRFQWKKG